ncbi:hypothetical protein VCRA217O134_300041 [Vibrio crassostreae]|nr:hypothetical protein VCRA217O134_300041 [Vibrio crassostreae]
MGWRDDLILRAERLECGVHDTLTYYLDVPESDLHGQLESDALCSLIAYRW